LFCGFWSFYSLVAAEDDALLLQLSQVGPQVDLHLGRILTPRVARAEALQKLLLRDRAVGARPHEAQDLHGHGKARVVLGPGVPADGLGLRPQVAVVDVLDDLFDLLLRGKLEELARGTDTAGGAGHHSGLDGVCGQLLLRQSRVEAGLCGGQLCTQLLQPQEGFLHLLEAVLLHEHVERGEGHLELVGQLESGRGLLVVLVTPPSWPDSIQFYSQVEGLARPVRRPVWAAEPTLFNLEKKLNGPLGAEDGQRFQPFNLAIKLNTVWPGKRGILRQSN